MAYHGSNSLGVLALRRHAACVLVQISLIVVVGGCCTRGSKNSSRTATAQGDSQLMIPLPRYCQELLLARTGSIQVRDVHEAVFWRRQQFDYFGVFVTLETEEGTEGLYHQTFVFVKRREEGDWSKSRLFAVSLGLCQLFELPNAGLTQALTEIK